MQAGNDDIGVVLEYGEARGRQGARKCSVLSARVAQSICVRSDLALST